MSKCVVETRQVILGDSVWPRSISLEKSSGVCGYPGVWDTVHMRICGTRLRCILPVGETSEASKLLKSFLCTQNREKYSRSLKLTQQKSVMGQREGQSGWSPGQRECSWGPHAGEETCDEKVRKEHCHPALVWPWQWCFIWPESNDPEGQY